jgi:diguanylate cyclase (GGDEF)-like protein
VDSLETLSGALLGEESTPLRRLDPKSTASRSLEALGVIASRLKPDLRWAILVLNNEQFVLAAEHRLTCADQERLREFASDASHSALRSFGQRYEAEVKPLLTQTAELVGAVIAFGTTALDPVLDQQLNDICWFATLAIEQEHLYEDLAYNAHHDPLTGLWNRVWLENEVENALTQSRLTGNSVGLLVVGIDRFRVINEVLGNQTGNDLLRLIASRLGDAIPPIYPLARGSGDEFLVLLSDLPAAAPVNTIAEDLITCFGDSFRVRDHEIVLRASVGSAVAMAASCTSAELQNRAFTALQYAKKLARGQVARYDKSMAKTPPERLAMEQHLRFALQKGEFELYYQPQVDPRSRKLTGMEALLRWRHPFLGFISPGTFIPMAEEMGLIEEIGAWTLDEAIAQLDRWRDAGLGNLRMAVNVSALQFARPEFVSLVAQKLRRSKTPPSDLELEITEGVVMSDLEFGVAQMTALNDLGTHLAIDDFGTGHSSLAYLQRLPVHRLKIDRMFVREITSREQRPPLLSSIIQMAHALRLNVIGEGAETQEQVEALAEMECEEIQGYYYSKPLPASDFQKWAIENNFVERPAVTA